MRAKPHTYTTGGQRDITRKILGTRVSALYLDNRLVHYEVFGRGQPVIFLHSWVGSWRYWVSTMDQVSVRCRTYALDFWGFGESDRNFDGLAISTCVEMLCQFIATLSIPSRVTLVGHGLGGMVAIRAAKEHPELFSKLMLVSTPLDGSILQDVVKGGTFSRLLGHTNPTNTWSKLVRQVPIDNEEIQQELYEDTDSLSEQIVSSIQSSVLNTDLRPTLRTLDESIPVLVSYGEKDAIVSPEHAKFLNNDDHERPHQLIIFRGTNHFPFLEDTTTFSRTLLDFLVSEGSPIEVKNQWRRRVSQREYL